MEVKIDKYGYEISCINKSKFGEVDYSIQNTGFTTQKMGFWEEW